MKAPSFRLLTCTAVPRFWHRPKDVSSNAPEPTVGTLYYAAKPFAHSAIWQFWPVSAGLPYTEQSSYANTWQARKIASFAVLELYLTQSFEDAQPAQEEAA